MTSDDGLTSVQNEQEAIQLVKDAQTICSTSGIRLHKFVSNSRSVIDSISASERFNFNFEAWWEMWLFV